MYSPAVVERRLFALKQQGVMFKRRSNDERRAVIRKLVRLYDTKSDTLVRPLTTAEQQFIDSELILCKWDFRYWAEVYGTIALDSSTGGGVGPMEFWESQNRALEVIGKREEEIQEEFEKHGFSDGVMTIWHKARQLGATTIMRLINMHRMSLHKHTRSLAASLDEPKVLELWEKDFTIVNNLPWFLKPKVFPMVMGSHFGFEGLSSRIVYQKAGQEGGIGTSQQFDINHCTEVALWAYPERLKFDLLPAIPQSPFVFTGWESTAAGRSGFWYEFTEDIRKRKYGFGHWTYIFTPWYIESKKYRRAAPDDWDPLTVTKQHAELVEKTSAEFCGSKRVLSNDQLYWWETEYELNRKGGTLHIFLSNFCATPEQSFQHSGGSAFPIETIEWLRSCALMGMPYHVSVEGNRA